VTKVQLSLKAKRKGKISSYLACAIARIERISSRQRSRPEQQT